MSGNHFIIFTKVIIVSLTLSFKHKISTGHVLTKINQHVKYESL